MGVQSAAAETSLGGDMKTYTHSINNCCGSVGRILSSWCHFIDQYHYFSAALSPILMALASIFD